MKKDLIAGNYCENKLNMSVLQSSKLNMIKYVKIGRDGGKGNFLNNWNNELKSPELGSIKMNMLLLNP